MAVKTKDLSAAAPAYTGGIKRVKTAELKGAKYNPSSRTFVNSNKMRQLIRSIEEEGLIYPIAIGDDNIIIDGHRRYAAVRYLGWEDVPCLVLKNKNPSKLYADINSTPELMNGLQVLQVWMQEPAAVSPRAQRLLDRYEETFGRPAMRKVIKASMSYHTLGLAERVARYCEDDSPEFLSRVLDWLIKHRHGRLVRSYITLKQPPAKLWRQVDKDSELAIEFSTTEA